MWLFIIKQELKRTSWKKKGIKCSTNGNERSTKDTRCKLSRSREGTRRGCQTPEQTTRVPSESGASGDTVTRASRRTKVPMAWRVVLKNTRARKAVLFQSLCTDSLKAAGRKVLCGHVLFLFRTSPGHRKTGDVFHWSLAPALPNEPFQ